jgi:hypothetical protein
VDWLEPPPQAARMKSKHSSVIPADFIAQIIRHNKVRLEAESCKIDP